MTPEQRKYLIELAQTFVVYDLKLDKKRKENSAYKEALRKKRIDHLGRTLEYMAQEETPAQKPSTAYKTLDNYVQTPRIVTPTQPRVVTPSRPSIVTTPTASSRPSLVSRMYQSSKNATSNAYNATKGFTKKYWKYGVTFIAGAAVGSLLTYYCMTKPVTKPVPQPIKQEQVIPKHEYKKPETYVKPKTEIKKPVVKQEPVVPRVEQILSEKDWTNKVKKGDVDFTKYDVFFSGMWNDPGAIVLYEKGNDKIRFDTALSGQIMWDKVETKKELEDLVRVMEKNNMFGPGRIALRAEYVKDKDGKVLGIIFTDALSRSQVNQKDGKVMVYSVERHSSEGY